MKSAMLVLHDIMMVWISVDDKKKGIPDGEKERNGLTLER